MKVKHTSIEKSYVFADPIFIFSGNGSKTRPPLKKLFFEGVVDGVVLVSLLLTLNIFHTVF